MLITYSMYNCTDSLSVALIFSVFFLLQGSLKSELIFFFSIATIATITVNQRVKLHGNGNNLFY